MLIKFVGDFASYKKDQEVDLADADAQLFIDSKKAVAVKNEQDDQLEAFATKLLADVDAKVEAGITKGLDKVGKAFAKRPVITVGKDRIEDDPKGGYKNIGELAQEVKSFQVNHVASDRLKVWQGKSQATTETGGATADGGALLPPGFIAEFIDTVAASNSLWPYIDSSPTDKRVTTIPYPKHYDFSNSTASAGVVASFRSEGSDGTPSKGQFEILSLTLKTLDAFVPTTEELEEDAPLLASHLASEGPRQLNETITKSIMQTVSSGPTPILGHASVKLNLRAVANQVALADILKVYSRFYGDLSKAVWIAHPTVIPQLGSMTAGSGTSAPNIFMPQGIQSPNFNTLMGRPLVISQYAKALGTEGDIGLYDLSKYKAVYRQDGVTQSMSMHLYFLSAQNLYRFTFRYDGKPKLTTTITLADGSTTVSPFSVLDDATT